MYKAAISAIGSFGITLINDDDYIFLWYFPMINNHRAYMAYQSKKAADAFWQRTSVK